MPNGLRLAVACEALDKLCGKMGRFDTVLRLIRSELYTALFVDPHPAFDARPRAGRAGGFGAGDAHDEKLAFERALRETRAGTADYFARETYFDALRRCQQEQRQLVDVASTLLGAIEEWERQKEKVAGARGNITSLITQWKAVAAEREHQDSLEGMITQIGNAAGLIKRFAAMPADPLDAAAGDGLLVEEEARKREAAERAHRQLAGFQEETIAKLREQVRALGGDPCA